MPVGIRMPPGKHTFRKLAHPTSPRMRLPVRSRVVFTGDSAGSDQRLRAGRVRHIQKLFRSRSPVLGSCESGRIQCQSRGAANSRSEGKRTPIVWLREPKSVGRSARTQVEAQEPSGYENVQRTHDSLILCDVAKTLATDFFPKSFRGESATGNGVHLFSLSVYLALARKLVKEACQP
jgi:hypothetical protein